MSITVDFSPADAQIIQHMADMKQMSISEYIQGLTINAIREEELERIDRRLAEAKSGKVVYKTMEELEAMASVKPRSYPL